MITDESDHFSPDVPYPVKIEICGHCGEPWREHTNRARARMVAWATAKKNAQLYPEECDAPEDGPKPLSFKDCVALLREKQRGPQGPPGPQGAMGLAGRCC